MRWSGRAGVVLLTVLAAAACSSAHPAEQQARTTWSATALPDGFEPSLLAPGPDGSVLVAADGDASGHRGPRLLEVHDGSTTAVPVTVETYYGRRTIWDGITVTGRRVYAFGGRSGGAHGITRWTAWSGALGPGGGVAEDAQDFETFGGPMAGGLAQVVVPAVGPPLLAGSRVSERGSGLDIAIWAYDRGQWVRRASAGTPLAADDDHQPSVGGMARRGSGLLLAGSITSFADGVHTDPAIWTSPGSTGPWTYALLPADDAPVAAARSAACNSDGACVVVGYVGEHLAAWTLSPAGVPAEVELPTIAAGPTSERITAYAAAGTFALTVDDPDGRGHLLVGDGDTWRELEVPAGTPAGFALTGHALWWATTSPGGARLWTAPALTRRFAADTGQSALQYLQSQRVRRAQHLLTTTQQSVAEVARRVGYRDPATFSQLFRRTAGLSPRDYRAQFGARPLR